MDPETSLSAPAAPALPPNVTIFSPSKSSTAKALLNGSIFTRLTANAQTEPSKLKAALRDVARPEVNDTFCFSHRNVVLIFDGKKDGDDSTDQHHEHFRLVCLALKDADISLDVAGCIFDAAEVLQAGFQLDTLSSGSILVIDLMGGDDDDDDSDEDDEAAAESLAATGTTKAGTPESQRKVFIKLGPRINVEGIALVSVAPEAGIISSSISGTLRDRQAQLEWQLLGEAGEGKDSLSDAALSVRPIETIGLKFQSFRSVDERMDLTR
ncbi:hypothetical protein CFIO01_12036 [Colletotrichum fioriniae PJ7]|uniref:Uncharacterized protein n=1 Tax=Colletotrichum fioriniae PJ7 TaxID=1445577 RepID=A0A010RWZ3_9PEZI|nr:hypothetical protein CFIO01_12036 [Colletotrichum fioriniae PJ7]